uniref:J domain-containing protein n=1 Tax=Opuntia streptacantha TaxID=393608 RepID=A0A7C9CGM7_OPUST
MNSHPTAGGGAANPNPNRAEAERLLGIAEKLLQTRDLTGSREFAMLAQETEPLLEGSDQILAITDVLLASERRVNNNRHHDWYAILQTDRSSIGSDPDLLKKNYRRLALLLHPDKNKYPLADSAFKLVADAWAVLSDPSKRSPYDHELSLFSKVDLRHQPPPDKDKLPVRRSPRAAGGSTATASANSSSFWTACPYCYVLYEYPRVYEECCLRCQNCERAFHAASIPSLPPMVPGKEAYYCCWGFFPLGFSLSKIKDGGGGGGSGVTNVNDHVNVNINVSNNNADATASANANANNPNSGFPNWMPGPGIFTSPAAPASQTQAQAQAQAQPQPQAQGFNMNVNMNASAGGLSDGSGSAGAGFGSAPPRMGVPGAKKRGRPRKNPVPA